MSPNIVKKRAIDVTPYEHGIYCTVGGGKPFVNDIVGMRWREDGRISVQLGSHNFAVWHPYADVDVVELPGKMIDSARARHERFLNERPKALMLRSPLEDLP